MLQQRADVGVEIVGPRESAATRAMLDYANRSRLPYQWRDGDDGLPPEQLPLVRLPEGAELRGPSFGEVSRALGIGLELAPSEEVDLAIVGGGPAGLGAAVYGASEGLETDRGGRHGARRPGRRVAADRELPRLPGRDQRSSSGSRAVTQARKFGARTATPYRVLALEPGADRHVLRLEGDHEIAARAVVLATGADYRRLPVAGLDDYEGISVFYAAGPPEARLCGASRVAVVGAATRRLGRLVWLARGGALVALLHRRAELRETMSDYLIAELERYGVAVRDRSEISELHGSGGRLEAVTLADGDRLPVGFLFLFLGASPCTDWLGDTVTRDDHGFVLTGDAAGADGLLETSVGGVYAVGDVRWGSVKRCATAVGEGAMVVRFVHERMSGVRLIAGRRYSRPARTRPVRIRCGWRPTRMRATSRPVLKEITETLSLRASDTKQ